MQLTVGESTGIGIQWCLFFRLFFRLSRLPDSLDLHFADGKVRQTRWTSSHEWQGMCKQKNSHLGLEHVNYCHFSV